MVGKGPTELFVKYGGPRGYYIAGDLDVYTACSDRELAIFLGIDFREYTKYLINECNGHKEYYEDDIWFYRKEDAKKACEWVNSLLIVLEMRKTYI